MIQIFHDFLISLELKIHLPNLTTDYPDDKKDANFDVFQNSNFYKEFPASTYF